MLCTSELNDLHLTSNHLHFIACNLSKLACHRGCRPNATLFRIWFGTFPNRNFDFGLPKSEFSIWNIHVWNVIIVPNPIWDIPNQIWNIVRFGTHNVLNLTMSQINIGTFGVWMGFGYVIPNPSMHQMCLLLC